MRYLLMFWAGPIGFLVSWYFMSLNDVNFGTMFLSRQFHDLVFTIYGNILGVDPETIPPLVARACVMDTALIFVIIALRKRVQIKSWWSARSAQKTGLSEVSNLILSKAP